jgi:hypothetical protein
MTDRVISSQLLPSLFDQLRGPGLIREAALDLRAEIHKLGGGGIVVAALERWGS